MDLITSDPSSTQSSSSKSTASAAPAATLPHQTAAAATASTDRKKKGMLMQIQSDTISAAKAALNPVRMPQRQKKKVLLLPFSMKKKTKHVFLVL